MHIRLFQRITSVISSLYFSFDCNFIKNWTVRHSCVFLRKTKDRESLFFFPFPILRKYIAVLTTSLPRYLFLAKFSLPDCSAVIQNVMKGASLYSPFLPSTLISDEMDFFPHYSYKHGKHSFLVIMMIATWM